jgi:hypothetical protein
MSNFAPFFVSNKNGQRFKVLAVIPTGGGGYTLGRDDFGGDMNKLVPKNIAPPSIFLLAINQGGGYTGDQNFEPNELQCIPFHGLKFDGFVEQCVMCGSPKDACSH